MNNFSSDPTNHAIPNLIIHVPGRNTKQTMSLGYLYKPVTTLPAWFIASHRCDVVYDYASEQALVVEVIEGCFFVTTFCVTVLKTFLANQNCRKDDSHFSLVM